MCHHLNLQLGNYFWQKKCEVFTEFDVRLFADEDTICRPDLLVL